MIEERLIRDGLTSAAEDRPRPDDAAQLWARGRRRRSRRRGAAVLAVAAAAGVGALGLTGVVQDDPGPADVAARSIDPLPHDVDRVLFRVQCLQGKGWDARYDGRGTWSSRTGALPGLDAAVAECDAALGLDLWTVGSAVYGDREVLGEFYDGLQPVVRCLAGSGLPVVAPPDRDFFVDRILYQHDLSWHPYDGAVQAQRLTEAIEVCPPASSPWAELVGDDGVQEDGSTTAPGG